MRQLSILLGVLLLVACGSDKALDAKLAELIRENQLEKDFQADLAPESEAVAELGGRLFFSPDLSIDGSVSCASCHHPDKGGADGLSLPVGIGGVDSRFVGEKRIKEAQKANPDLSLEGFIPRNSPTVINAALYRQVMFWDGRVQYTRHDKYGTQNSQKRIVSGFGAGQANPSNYLQQNLLQTQARMPISSPFEMKGALKPDLNNHDIEQSVLQFLQSKAHWCEAFAKAFGEKPCKELITLNHLTQALAEFEATLVMVDSPFEQYIHGDKTALTEEQKRGAILFLSDKKAGGAGCVNCHSGKTFTNERFYNINIPPSGRGANGGGWDLGRNNVDKSAERFSFRVPNLLNVAETAPYFHNGTALTLEDAIRHKQTAPDVDKTAHIIELHDVDYAPIREAIQEGFDKGAGKTLLPKRLSEKQITDLAAFLHSLTDDCLLKKACMQANMAHEVVESPRKEPAEQKVSQMKPRHSASAKMPEIDCSHIQASTAPGKQGFTRHNVDLGITHKRKVGLIRKGWLMDMVNNASVSATDLTGNCLDDLVFDAGTEGLLWYEQQPDGQFKRHEIAYEPEEGAVNALVMDLDGDYRQDLFVGNYGQGAPAFVFDFLDTSDDVIAMRDLKGPVINASIGDIEGDGNMDVIFAMWRSYSSIKQPHIWFNDGEGNIASRNAFIPIRQDERQMWSGGMIEEDLYIRQESENQGVPDFTFTPNFVDINNNDRQDLLVAADFFRSQVLKNEEGYFVDVSNKEVIDDSNGMGSAIADFNNDGMLDWYITSINDEINPLWDGHRLYINQGQGRFKKQTLEQKKIDWGWGTCAADFNNDGYQDIFYISGFGEPLPTATYEDEPQKEASEGFLKSMQRFSTPTPTLMVNDGEGGFTDQSKAFGLTEQLAGRGVACFDYQQDGDMDIVVAPVEGVPVLFKNHLDGEKNWLSIRLIGLPGNTEAFGTKVTLYTKQGKQYRQIRFRNNFVSRSPAQIHFGLGDLKAIEKIAIELPSPQQATVELENVEINRLHVFEVKDLLELSSD